LESNVSEKTVEWNLGFAYDEVVVGLEKLLSQGGYTYTRSDTDTEAHFHVALMPGTLSLIAKPLLSHRSPFNSQIILHRTLLTITCVGVAAHDEESFFRRLTLTFLRAGG
jgi:hypothetical protein